LSAGDVFLWFAAIAVGSALVIGANFADSRPNSRVRTWVLGELFVLNVGIVVVFGILPVIMAYSSASQAPDEGDAWRSLAFALVVGGVSSLMLYEGFRVRIAALFPQRRETDDRKAKGDHVIYPADDLMPRVGETPLFLQMLNYYTEESSRTFFEVEQPVLSVSVRRDRETGQAKTAVRGFDPSSTVHMTAAVLCIYFLGIQLINFVLGGGLEGIAEAYEEGLTAGDLLLNVVPFVLIPVLGTGLGTRRNWKQVLERLDVRLPTMREFALSLGIAIGLLIFIAIVAAIWMALVSDETYEEQTRASEALAESVTSIGIAFLLAVTAAVGEEIAYRGALQPVFGLWPTAIVFTLTHAQYTLTPAWLMIFGVALTFGWVRDRYGTSTAILVHFFYDFIPLSIAVAAPSESLWAMLPF